MFSFISVFVVLYGSASIIGKYIRCNNCYNNSRNQHKNVKNIRGNRYNFFFYFDPIKKKNY